MSYEKVKPCGGSGGKKGHSNMAHWTWPPYDEASSPQP
jgi:hypothetical protein